MIDVQTIQLTTHKDKRGFFREIARFDDIGFIPKQWSHSLMYQGVIKAWHIHKVQWDLWYVASGVMLAVMNDRRQDSAHFGQSREWLMGEGRQAQALLIPPGVAHGLKVIQGPCHMLYATSEVYNPDDEGRIEWDSLDYDWFENDIQ